MKYQNLRTPILLILTVVGGMLFAQDKPDAATIYQQGREFCIEGQWQLAQEQFQTLLSEFPGSNYEDRALFWLGYSMEKIPGRQMDAYLTFDRIIRNLPLSSWVDDAQLHQITLAASFVREGKSQYLAVLKKHLNSKYASVQRKAAIELARLGDKSAIPMLEKLADGRVPDKTASEMLALLRNPDGADQSRDDDTNENQNLPDSEIEFRMWSDENSDPQRSSKQFPSMFIGTRRFKQYQQLLRKSDTWTKQELFDVGMWHILPDDTFQEYFSLTDEADRREWRRKYWKRNDPTPTTEENEYQKTFEERVLYAKANFYQRWNYRFSRYLKEQYLRDGWPHSPWDARGELYIKFGAPDSRTVEGWHTETWTYARFDADFMVQLYMTNIYGNAIEGNRISSRFHRAVGDREWVEVNYIYANEMDFQLEYDGKAINKFDMKILGRQTSISDNILISYSLGKRELHLENRDGGKYCNYLERYIVLDEDFREVVADEQIIQVDVNRYGGGNINQEISLNLPPGNYIIALRIEDSRKKRLGIFRTGIQVREDGKHRLTGK